MGILDRIVGGVINLAGLAMVLVFLMLVVLAILIAKTESIEIKTGGERMDELIIQNPWFDEIVAGRKTVEGRAAHRSRYEPFIGKTIKIKERGGNREALVKVTDVRSYPDLEAYLEAEGWEKTAPHTESIEGARKAYADIMMKKNIQVFSPERVAQRGGIQAIEMILVDP